MRAKNNSRSVVVAMLFFLGSCNMEQFNPKLTIKKENCERLNSNQLPPKLNEDGSIPALKKSSKAPPSCVLNKLSLNK